MDLLSQALVATHLQSSLLATLEMTGPWAIDFEHASGAPTFYVREGRAWLLCPPGDPVLLETGDLVMLPRWDWFILCSSADVDPVPIRDVVQRAGATAWVPGQLLDEPIRLKQSGTGETCRLLAMAFRVERPERDPLILGLPRCVLIRNADRVVGGLLEATCHFLDDEASGAGPGFAVASNRLAELLFIQIVRRQLATAPTEMQGMLRGLAEPGIGRALAAIHERPAAHWTIASLAAVAGMSRSVFAAHFATLIGCTVLRYLTDRRVELARDAIAGGASIKAAAAAAGYASGTALAKAMQRADAAR